MTGLWFKQFPERLSADRAKVLIDVGQAMATASFIGAGMLLQTSFLAAIALIMAGALFLLFAPALSVSLARRKDPWITCSYLSSSLLLSSLSFYGPVNNHNGMTTLPSIVLTSLLVLFCACSTNPLTQRRQIILTSEDQELALGEVQYRELLQTVALNQDREANRLVRKVGTRIAHAVNRSDYAWEFVVISDPTVAFARVFPSGKVVVYTGIFPVAEDETGLAIILSHDAAHALARHHGEKASREVLMELGSMGVTFGPDLARQAYNAGSAMGLILPFGQIQESEADRLGLLLAAKAGYDPSAALAVWERMAREGEKRGQPPQFLLTHPGYNMRRQIVSQYLPEALQYYSQVMRIENPEQLPPLASVEPTDDTERSLTQAMGTLDQLAAVSPDGHEAVVKAVAEELQLTPQAVEAPTRSFALRPGESTFVFTLAEASGKSIENLVAAVAQTRSWPAVATDLGIPLTELLPRVQTIAESAQRQLHQEK